MKQIEILYEDDFCLILNKPAGLAVQGGKGLTVSLDSILAETYSPRPLLVHRLDRDTSGVILTAKTKAAAARFSRLLGEERTGDRRTGADGVIKQYLAVCAGKPAAELGVISMDLEIRGSVKQSETRYKVINSASLEQFQFSLLELELRTGRMHQIRRHLAMTGNPILGDDKYGDFALNKKLRKTMHIKRLLLHASRLVIMSRAEGIQLDICAPLPDCPFRPFLIKP
ncbi:MAG: RluA family pseudouridine synthase [Treponema sp.]|nr:RluA family pseudouridine synthase [Treponema sp.]